MSRISIRMCWSSSTIRTFNCSIEFIFIDPHPAKIGGCLIPYKSKGNPAFPLLPVTAVRSQRICWFFSGPGYAGGVVRRGVWAAAGSAAPDPVK
jgi:hypothetical protein